MVEQDQQSDLIQVVAQITAAVTNTSLYSLTHPLVGQYIEKAHTVLTDILRSRPEVTLLIIGGDLIAENKPFPAGSTYVQNFVRILKKKSVERLTFIAGVPLEELRGLIKDLTGTGVESVHSRPCIKLGKVEIRVKEHSGKYVHQPAGVVSTDASASEAQQQYVAPEVLQELLALTAAELDELKEIYSQIKKHKQINIRGIEDIVKGFVKGFRQEINPLGILASLKSSHEYTFTHVTNVGILTMSQAERLGFTGEHLHQIGVASLLHDVGKLFIPDEILSKASKLTSDEREVIETHTVKGARYLMGLEGIPKLAVLAALEHHLKYDGTGYPTIKTGWKPNIVSQMISVADVFDAMRSKRSYQEAMPMSRIEEVMHTGKGKSFNPQLVDHFMNMVNS